MIDYQPYFFKEYNNCVDFCEVILSELFNKTLPAELHKFRGAEYGSPTSEITRKQFLSSAKPAMQKHQLIGVGDEIPDGLVVALGELCDYATHMGISVNKGLLHHYGDIPQVQWQPLSLLQPMGLNVIGYYKPLDLSTLAGG